MKKNTVEKEVLTINISALNEERVDACRKEIEEHLKSEGFKQRKIKTVEENGVLSFTLNKKGYLNINDSLIVYDVDMILVDYYADLSKKYDCSITLNFKLENEYQDVIFTKGEKVFLGHIED